MNLELEEQALDRVSAFSFHHLCACLMHSGGCYYQPVNKKGFHSFPPLGTWLQVVDSSVVDVLLSRVSCGFSGLSSAPRAHPPPAASHFRGGAEVHSVASLSPLLIYEVVLSEMHLILSETLKKPDTITINVCD